MKQANMKGPGVIFVLLLIGISTRFLFLGENQSFLPNFAAVGAVALFGSNHLRGKSKYILPLFIMWVSDLFLNNLFYASYFDSFQFFGSFWVYAGFLLVVLVGHFIMRKPSWLTLIGAGIGGGIAHTQELNVMKYNEAMAGVESTDWAKQVAKEHRWMLKDKVWKPILRSTEGVKRTITSTWAMKKKANGDKRARVNAQGLEQIPWVHYNPKKKALPVVNMTTIRIILVLWASCGAWTMKLLDVCRAFLKGKFEEGDEKVYMEVLQGFKHIYKQVGKECKDGLIQEEDLQNRAMELHKEWMKKPEEHWEVIKNHQKAQGA